MKRFATIALSILLAAFLVGPFGFSTPSGSLDYSQAVAAVPGPIDVKTFGAKGDGVTDDTTAIQTAINTGYPVYISPGTYVISASLNLTTTANHGQVIRGAGPLSKNGSGGSGTAKSIIKPTVAVSKAFVIDGTSFSNYVQYFGFENFTVDMTNMTDAATSMAFNQVQAWGGQYRNITVVNTGTNKRSIVFNAGAFTTIVQGGSMPIIEATGLADNNQATTLSFIDVDTTQFILNYASAVSIHGGTIQGTVDKFTGYSNGISGALGGLYHVTGLMIYGLDVEGASGTYLKFGASCNSIFAMGNQLTGFAGTLTSGAPAGPYIITDRPGGGSNNFFFTDGNFKLYNNNQQTTAQLLSGGAASYYQLGVGRTGIDLGLSVAGATNDFITGTAAGDAVIGVGGARAIWLQAGSAGVAKLTSQLAQIQSARLQDAQGASVPSANNLTLGADGNYFQITGTTQVNLLDNTNWQGGSVVTLKFNGIVLVKNNQAASGNFKPIVLNGGVDLTTAAGNTLTLRYDSTDATWYEMSRKT